MKRKEDQQNKREYKDKSIETDPFGSYTGRPEYPQEKPIQDADDL